VLLAAQAQAHERAVGAWQAEWGALSGLLACAGGAVAAAREALEGLRVDARRMRENLDATGGLVLAERVAGALAERLGRDEAQEVVTAAAGSGAFRDALADQLTADELDAVLDPETYLGSAGVFVDRVLERASRELDAR
jgi:3-carboxy-cis,cis-muconate cycloisomerase